MVELREGQTLAIAGLLQLRTTGTTSRIPGLGDLPLVGPWFSANQITSIETETVILVTPELVAPLEKHEVTETARRPGLSTQRRRVLSAGPDRRKTGPRIPGLGGRPGSAPSHEALPERAAMGSDRMVMPIDFHKPTADGRPSPASARSGRPESSDPDVALTRVEHLRGK